MPTLENGLNERFDRTNAILATIVLLVTMIVYALTVQRSLSFWDCGEFIASAYILGIPHPPGTPLFVLLGRVFSVIPFVEDISYRINYISVISSAFTAMFSYLLTVRLVGYFFEKNDNSSLSRLIAYCGGLAGGFFVAFSRTNWGNSVEAEVYGMALALSVAIVWLTLRYFEQRGTISAARTMIIVFYLAMLGISAHMTVYLVVPACALFFILKKDAERRDWLILSGFIIVELLMIVLFANGRGGYQAFMLVSAILTIGVLTTLYKKINWSIVLAIGAISSVMVSFSSYIWITPVAFGLLVVLAIMSHRLGWHLQWKSAMAILVIAFIGMSVHAFIPIRSELNPRIDENNPSRGWQTFMNFLDRRQYGNVSMIERMFQRRGLWSNQFGRHPHMGYWSYFEEQYSGTGWAFLPFFVLGLIGIIVAIKKRLEIGLPFMTLFLLCSVGLILYMNFADGTQYNEMSGDAYLEVRNRDYFFTPAFVFFGIAMGMGVSAIMNFIRGRTAGAGVDRQKLMVYASTVLVLLPGISLSGNYHACDRSDNFIPYNYATNILDTCEPNAILFTSGDNDTFPVWCVQEVYNYRRDVRVVNLSLLQTDWYTEQMKNRYDVPISLTDEQILWYPIVDPNGNEFLQPKKMFADRARQRMTYLTPSVHNGRVVRVHEMMIDEIVIESVIKDSTGRLQLKQPIYFSSPPYAESPLGLREKTVLTGILYKLEMEPPDYSIDAEKSYDLFFNEYNFDGYENSDVYRDENATGVSYANGISATRVFDEFIRRGDTTKAKALMHRMITVYPEYTQTYLILSELYKREGDSATAEQLLQRASDTLSAFTQSNPENVLYLQDWGLAEVYLGQLRGDQAQVDHGVNLVWQAFHANPNSNPCFRKLFTVLTLSGKYAEIQEAARMHWAYKVNRTDPYLKQVMGYNQGGATPSRP